MKAAAWALLLLGTSGAYALTPVGAPSGTSSPAESPAPAPSASPLEDVGAVQAFELRLRAGETMPEALKVGDALKLSLPTIPGAGAAPRFEALPGEKSLYDQGWIAKLEELKRGPDGKSIARDPNAEVEINLIPTRAGAKATPPLVVRGADGKLVARVLPFAASVESGIAKDDPKPTEPDPAYPPQSAPFPWFWAVVIAVLVTALLSGLIFFLVRRLQGRRAGAVQPMPTLPPVPEDIRAMKQLAELEALGLPEKGEFKRQYFAVSEILKAYLGARYRFDALESTSAELLAMLRGIPEFPSARVASLQELFDRMDLVKFADEVPPVLAARQIVAEARELVTTTKRPPPVVEGAKDLKEAKP